jgi:hypothetical protein
MRRDFSKEFRYGYTPVPHRDFAFGTPWVLGAGPTTSNRRGKSAIQIYSAQGCYNNGARINGRCQSIPPNESPAISEPDPRSHYLYFKNPKQSWSSTTTPSSFDAEKELPFEPPRSTTNRRKYDMGPGRYADDLLDYYKSTIPFHDKFVQSKSFGHTGIYRGRFKNITLLVLADQFDFTDMFSGRALTGKIGQKLSAFLRNFGKDNDYLILRTLPANCVSNNTDCKSVAFKRNVIESRNKIIKQVLNNNNIKIIFTLGETANLLKKTIPSNNAVIINLDHNNLDTKKLESLFIDLYSKEISPGSLIPPSYKHTISSEYIPREDLPFHTRWWMGTAGDSSSQAKEKIVLEVKNSRVVKYKVGKENGDYYKLYSPGWNNSWRPDQLPLTPEELNSLTEFNKTN